MRFELNLFTVVMLVGPSRSGKTTFAKALTAALESFAGVRVAHLSSDAYRRQLAGDLADDDERLAEVSAGAFAMLNAELEARMAWPVNTEVIILDTTAMNEKFRDQVRELAKKHQYRVDLVVFDYSHGEYLKGAADTHAARKVVLDHAKRMKEDVLPNLKRKQYHRTTSLRKRSPSAWADLTVVLDDYDLFQQTYWSNDQKVVLIGDVHEAVGPFKELLTKLPEDGVRVQLGDWIDKGERVAEAVAAMEAFVAAGGRLLMGNHENYVAKRIQGQIEENTDLEASYFTSVKVLQADTALAERFLALVAQALPFIVLRGPAGRTVYVSHAPAPTKNLGKLDAESLVAQRNYRMTSESSEELLEKLEALGPIGRNEPLHVFGHLAHQSRVFQRGRVFLDTGSVYGHRLSALVLAPGKAPDLIQVAGEKRAEGTLYNLEVRKAPAAADLRVSPAEQVFMDKFVESGARYLSGTIAPAPATESALESPAAALEVMRQHKATRVIVEPKYMGSRAQVYLFKGQPERSFAISRKGFVIKAPEIQPVLAAVYAQFAEQDFWTESLILDGELMPWRAIGGALIDSEFERYGAAANAELTLLAADPVFQSFAVGQAHQTSKRQAGLCTFNEQVALYGQAGEPHYKPFTVLAADGADWTGRDQAEVFKLVAPHEPCLVLETDAADAEAQLIAFFTRLTEDERMEGVVIKPCVFEADMVPFMKVRNEKYLHIIYGYDYQLRYASMCANKRIQRKLTLSRKEFFLGRDMLRAPDEANLRLAMLRMQGELAKESALDPRL